jgi:hypothetical protein
VTYPENYAHLDEFMRMVIAFRMHQHPLIQKASEQVTATPRRRSPPSSRTSTHPKCSPGSTRSSLLNFCK